jgi:UDP-N-acetyl-D-galactosamine dehydrogenase
MKSATMPTNSTIKPTNPIAILNTLPNLKLAVIGLGYVGLPLAVEFGKKRSVVGFDINQKRIDALRAGFDQTLETEREELLAATQLSFSTDIEDLRAANCFIVTVPTPIDEHKRPDLTPLIKASELIGKVLKKGDIVIYESTVYPGATEEDCVPVLEKFRPGVQPDFFAGYSPERINPGDKQHRLTTSKRSPPARRRKSPTWSTRSTTKSSSPVRTKPPASRSPRRQKSSRTPSATSTSR